MNPNPFIIHYTRDSVSTSSSQGSHMKKGGVSLPKSGPVDSIVDYASLVSSLKTLFLFALLLCSCFFLLFIFILFILFFC